MTVILFDDSFVTDILVGCQISCSFWDKFRNTSSSRSIRGVLYLFVIMCWQCEALCILSIRPDCKILTITWVFNNCISKQTHFTDTHLHKFLLCLQYTCNKNINFQNIDIQSNLPKHYLRARTSYERHMPSSPLGQLYMRN